MGNHFFVLTSVDGSKPHKPVGCSVMDIPTAYAFFGSDPSKTCARVTAAVNGLVQRWNETEALKPSVSLTPPQLFLSAGLLQKLDLKTQFLFLHFSVGRQKSFFSLRDTVVSSGRQIKIPSRRLQAAEAARDQAQSSLRGRHLPARPQHFQLGVCSRSDPG